MTQHFNDIARKLGDNRSFYLSQNNEHFQGYLHNPAEKHEKGELVARRIFGLGARNHQHALQVHYVVIAQGPECVLYREIYEGQLHEQGKQPTDPPVLVLRYLGENQPEAHAVVKDMDAAFGRAITLLSHKIQGGN